MLLALSLVSILIGPIILYWFPQNRRLDSFLFSFVLIAVGGMLLLDILPMLWQHINFWLIPLLLVGFFGPGLVEVSFRHAADKAHKIALLLGIIGLMIHSALDGMAVIQNENSMMMPYAVILHRLIVGLSIWWLVQPVWGNTKSYLVFLLIITATLMGYFVGKGYIFDSVNLTNNHSIDYFQALISGTLLHVIIHRPHIDEDGHHHDHAHALEADPNHHHSHGIVIKHKAFFALGAMFALGLLGLLHHFH